MLYNEVRNDGTRVDDHLCKSEEKKQKSSHDFSAGNIKVNEVGAKKLINLVKDREITYNEVVGMRKRLAEKGDNRASASLLSLEIVVAQSGRSKEAINHVLDELQKELPGNTGLTWVFKKFVDYSDEVPLDFVPKVKRSYDEQREIAQEILRNFQDKVNLQTEHVKQVTSQEVLDINKRWKEFNKRRKKGEFGKEISDLRKAAHKFKHLKKQNKEKTEEIEAYNCQVWIQLIDSTPAKGLAKPEDTTESITDTKNPEEALDNLLRFSKSQPSFNDTETNFENALKAFKEKVQERLSISKQT